MKSKIKLIANPVLNDLALLAIEEGIRLADKKLNQMVEDLKRDRKRGDGKCQSRKSQK